MPILPPDFDFSQGSLQDYQDCRRRFRLRYLDQLRYPVPPAEPVEEFERAQRRGERFHLLAQQALLGLPFETVETLAAAGEDLDLQRWLQNFKGLYQTLRGDLLVETMLSTRLVEEHRLVAKFDLLVFDGDRAVIFDWKTSAKMPKRLTLEQRLQSRVYPLVLALAGGGLRGGGLIAPEKIEMIYWFTEFPDQALRFAYDRERLERDQGYVTSLIETIRSESSQGFAQTEDERRCRFCVYRSWCDRGANPGDMGDMGDEDLPDPGIEMLDLDAIQAIEI